MLEFMVKRSYLINLSLILLGFTPSILAQVASVKSFNLALASLTLLATLGAILLLIGIAFLLIEVILCSYGIFAISGLIIFTAGLLMLVNESLMTSQFAWAILAAVVLFTLGLLIFTGYLAFKSHKAKLVSGQETLLGKQAVVVSHFQRQHGWIRIQGELWQAYAEQPLQQDTQVEIIKIDGLTAWVKPIKI